MIGHLTDDDLAEFLINCKKNLTKNGFIVIKDNVATGMFIVDKTDFSIVRDDQYYKKIF